MARVLEENQLGDHHSTCNLRLNSNKSGHGSKNSGSGAESFGIARMDLIIYQMVLMLL